MYMEMIDAIKKFTIVYTADNEMPVCIHCDNFGTNFDCCKYCGAEHGWWGYRRTEVKEDA